MTSAVFNQIGRGKNYHLQNVPTSATAIYTSDKNLSACFEILVCNKDSSARTVTIQIYRAASATSFALASGKSIAANDVYRCDFPVWMLEGDEIRLTAGTVTTLDASLFVAEGIGRGG